MYRMYCVTVWIICWKSSPLPEHIKIDVDGSELALIKGAEKTLTNQRPKSIFIELNDTLEHSAQIKFILLSNNFKEILKYQVQHYAGLYNYIFERTSSAD